MRKFMRKYHCHRNKYNKIIGIVLGVMGMIIIIQVVPVAIWLLTLGILCLILGWSFFKMW
ncbi:hypothetical protein [Senegalia massiliensis]|uniref:Uncharacterized protein n=1 Tax=Senegalia massiliensis TaxID=1720316 RepID=A0A845QVE3_9CLOT|nr:hypothetical protein [Senegalia massiliensis]NBI06877.1 hypothetical protein [Senegalia massiliensis]